MQEELKFWLPEEDEKFLKSSSDLGYIQLLKFVNIFYNANMDLVIDFPTFHCANVLVHEYGEQFCKRICSERFLKTLIEFRAGGETMYTFPVRLLEEK